MIDSLVAYKGKPARVVLQIANKFDLEFADKVIIRARRKDFYFIHPHFAQVTNNKSVVDFSVLKDLQQELLCIKELTQWLFSDYYAQYAWQIYLLVEEGIFFYWHKDKIFVRPSIQVKAIQERIIAKDKKANSLQRCATNIKKNIIDEQDLPYIKDVEKVALNQVKYATILTYLQLDNTPQEAHKLLLSLKYWQQYTNPYPQRYKILDPQETDITFGTCDISRVDLTNLECFAIDNANSSDADDALSVDGDTFWVHIADVASLVETDSELDLYVQRRISSLYLPDKTIPMLPKSLVELCSLSSRDTAKALSVGFSIKNNEIINTRIINSVIKVKKISYADADNIIGSNKILLQLQNIAHKHRLFRKANGALHFDLPNVHVATYNNIVHIKLQKLSQSRDMVAEMMIITGRAIAEFAVKNNIAIPYLTQESGSFDESIVDKVSLTMAQKFQVCHCFKVSKTTTTHKLHFGLGLCVYLRATSPIRRYLDLVVHQQLFAFINNKNILNTSQVDGRIKKANALMVNINKTSKKSIEHFKCLYLLQNPNWQGSAVVVDLRGNSATVIIPHLAITTLIKSKIKVNLDEQVLVKVTSVDLVNCVAYFKLLKNIDSNLSK